VRMRERLAIFPADYNGVTQCVHESRCVQHSFRCCLDPGKKQSELCC
jgi:hypothetical protein